MKNLLISAAIALSATALLPQVAKAHCDFPELPSVEFSGEEKTITVGGYSFVLPAELRTVLKGDGSVLVMDEANYQFYTCTVREGLGTDNYSYISISMDSNTDALIRGTSGVTNYRSSEIVSGRRLGRFQTYSGEHVTYDVSGRSSIHVSSYYPTEVLSLVFTDIWAEFIGLSYSEQDGLPLPSNVYTLSD